MYGETIYTTVHDNNTIPGCGYPRRVNNVRKHRGWMVTKADEKCACVLMVNCKRAE